MKKSENVENALSGSWRDIFIEFIYKRIPFDYNNKVLKDENILFGFLDNNHFSPSSVDRKLPQVQFRRIVLSVVYYQLSFERRLLLC